MIAFISKKIKWVLSTSNHIANLMFVSMLIHTYLGIVVFLIQNFFTLDKKGRHLFLASIILLLALRAKRRKSCHEADSASLVSHMRFVL